MEQMNIGCDSSINEVGLGSIKYEEDVKEENITSYDTEVNVKTEIKDEVDIQEHALSCRQVRCDNPLNEVGLGSMKYEENMNEEKITYDTDISIKSEIKVEVEKEEHGLSCEQQRSIKIEDYKTERDNEYVALEAASCYTLLNRLTYVNDVEREHIVEDTSEGMELHMEKQNVVQKCHCNCCKYGIRDASRHCKNETNIEHNQSLLPCYKSENESTVRVAQKENVKYFKCDFCEHIAKQIGNLRRHFATKHSDIADLYQCFNCKFKTKVKWDIVRHFKLHHKRVEWHHCQICDFKTKCKGKLTVHHKVKHDDASETFHCELCYFTTKYRSTLTVHKLKHNDAAEIFHCELCDFKSKYRSTVTLHYKLKHDDAAEIFYCGQCNFKTKHRGTLTLHYKLKHDNTAEIFHCKLCDYKAKLKSSLLRHFIVKHDSAPEILYCEKCDFQTKLRCDMVSHHRLKHRVAAAIFHCNVCEFETKHRRSLLIHHRMKHDDTAEIFHCELCNFKTKNKQSLSRHQRYKHGNTAEFLCCKFCDFITKYKSNLLSHYRLKHDAAVKINSK